MSSLSFKIYYNSGEVNKLKVKVSDKLAVEKLVPIL